MYEYRTLTSNSHPNAEQLTKQSYEGWELITIVYEGTPGREYICTFRRFMPT